MATRTFPISGSSGYLPVPLREGGRIDPFTLSNQEASDWLLIPEKRWTYSTGPSLRANQRGHRFSKPCGRDVFHSLPHRRHLVLSFAFFLFIVPNLAPKEARAKQSSIRRSDTPQARVDSRLITLPVVEGKDIRFTRLSTSGRLPQTKVSLIVQDNQGFLWFGTRYGLNRYDGYNFKSFVPEPGNPNSISGADINALFKDRDGALWIGCDQLLNKLDPATETFKRYPIPFVTHISQDSAGKLWLATPAGGLYSLDPVTGRISQYTHDPNNPSSISSDHVIYSGEERGGRFWVATPGFLDEFDRRAGKVTQHIPMADAPLGFAFYEDRLGLFWIYHTSPNALAVFDRKTNTLTRYVLSDRESPGTAVTRVTAMMEDRRHSRGTPERPREVEAHILSTLSSRLSRICVSRNGPISLNH